MRFKNRLVIILLAGIWGAAVADECISLSQKHFDSKNYRQAVMALEKCNKNPDAWKLLGLSYFELAYMEEAKIYLSRAIEHNPEEISLKISYANALALNKEFKKAVAEFRRLNSEFPDNREIKKGLAQVLGWNKEYDASISAFRAVIAEDPQDFESWIQIGVLTSWNKKFKDAIDEFKKIVDAKPPVEFEIQARLHMAEVLSWQKKFDESIAEYRNIIKIEPKTIGAYLGVGTVYEWQGKHKDAKKEYEQALIVEPENTTAKGRLNQLMWVK